MILYSDFHSSCFTSLIKIYLMLVRVQKFRKNLTVVNAMMSSFIFYLLFTWDNFCQCQKHFSLLSFQNFTLTIFIFYIWQSNRTHSFTYCVCSFTDRKIPCPLLKGWAIKNNFRLDQSLLFEIVYETGHEKVLYYCRILFKF